MQRRHPFWCVETWKSPNYHGRQSPQSPILMDASKQEQQEQRRSSRIATSNRAFRTETSALILSTLQSRSAWTDQSATFHRVVSCYFFYYWKMKPKNIGFIINVTGARCLSLLNNCGINLLCSACVLFSFTIWILKFDSWRFLNHI